MRARRLAPLLFALAVLVSAAWLMRPYAHGLSFVVRAAGVEGTARRVADLDTTATSEREITIPTDSGPLRARVYEPSRSRRRTALLVSGLHPAGIDEPRLVGLARHLSGSGLTIVTPDISELSHFELDPTITDAIQEAGTWLSAEAALAPDHQVGLMGIGVSGGLSIVAAGRPAMAGRVAFVLSFGGHDDLPRVLRYLCTGVEPRPSNQVRLKADTTSEDPGAFVQPPDAYGLAGLILGLAHRVVPSGQVEPLRDAIRRFLSAPPQDPADAPQADTEFAPLRSAAKRMPRAVGHIAPIRLRPRRRASRRQTAALRQCVRRRSVAVAFPVTEAVGAGVSAAQGRRHPRPGSRVRISCRGPSRPRAGPPPHQRPCAPL